MLSNELVTTRLLICPSDSSVTPATNFVQVSRPNFLAHSSYRANFSLVAEEAGLSSSILARDRNLIPARHHLSGYSTAVPELFDSEWDGELHRFQGNILFADGHVNLLKNGSELRAVISVSKRARRPGARPVDKPLRPAGLRTDLATTRPAPPRRPPFRRRCAGKGLPASTPPTSPFSTSRSA